MGDFTEGKLDEKNGAVKFILWTLSLTGEKLKEPGFLAGMVAEDRGAQKKDRCT